MQSILSFLSELAINNNKSWFDTNRTKYEQAKDELIYIVKEVIRIAALTDYSLSNLQPKDCIFRINRDIRFSNDKSPYKVNMAFALSGEGKKTKGALYYIHIQPERSFVAGGLYAPEKEVLSLVRQEIDYNLIEFENIINDPNFKKEFGGLSTDGKLRNVPKGYYEENPAIEYLKNKNFIASKKLDNSDLNSESTFIKSVNSAIIALYPFIIFLNQPLKKE